MKKPKCFGEYLSKGKDGDICKYKCEVSKICRLDRAVGESIIWNRELYEALTDLDEEISLEQELRYQDGIQIDLEKIQKTVENL